MSLLDMFVLIAIAFVLLSAGLLIAKGGQPVQPDVSRAYRPRGRHIE